MASQIRYLSIITEHPEILAEFYGRYLGLRELGRGPAGDISMTDGFYNLTFLKQRSDLGEPDDRLGLNHFGVEIDDIREIEARLEEFAPNAEIKRENGDLHHGEYRVFDPNGIAVSLSTRRFGVPDASLGLPCIRHVAMSVGKNDEVLDFFRNVFGFREATSSHVWRDKGTDVRFAADGHTSLAILWDPEQMRKDSGEQELDIRYGVNHFGFLVPNATATLDSLPASSGTGRRPSNRPMAEFRAYDPDGTAFDISQTKGFEVDVDVWERVPEV
jgi:catechol 2,3-dioxygenase-like lactoylglutathione lyase family enzyme